MDIEIDLARKRMEGFIKMLLLSIGVLAVALIPFASASAYTYNYTYTTPNYYGYNGYNNGFYNNGNYNNGYNNYVNPDDVYNAIRNSGIDPNNCITRDDVVSALNDMDFTNSAYSDVGDFYNFLAPLGCGNFNRDDLAIILRNAGLLDNTDHFMYRNYGYNNYGYNNYGNYLNNYNYIDPDDVYNTLRNSMFDVNNCITRSNVVGALNMNGNVDDFFNNLMPFGCTNINRLEGRNALMRAGLIDNSNRFINRLRVFQNVDNLSNAIRDNTANRINDSFNNAIDNMNNSY